LQQGAKLVYGIDVGYGQTAWKIRKNPKVILFERTNIRNLKPNDLLSRSNELPNFVVADLSFISKIPEQTINSIENNDKKIRPKYPFIRSILIKLEECLVLKKNTLLKLASRERKILKKGGKDFLFRKFDLINTWQGSLLYFFILILTVFILKRFFILNINVIEIQNIENKIIEK